MNTQIIPAIDIIDGQCVRLQQGDFNRKTQYGLNPLEVAQSYEEQGYERLHVVDLDAAKGNGKSNKTTIKEIALKTNLKVDVGGGIKKTDQIEQLFESGVSAVNIGSSAIEDPKLFAKWMVTYGNNKIWLSADVNNTKIAINGWQQKTNIDLFNVLAQFEQMGMLTAVITSIDRDGMMKGPNIELYSQTMKLFPELNIVASGGVTTPDDLKKLGNIGISKAIVGKALYETDAFANRNADKQKL
jgi:phosphoribosylformimino-5-aminoimidazole carboxamide ribotide isomerase